ncbi:MAG: helix-turn-helix transcriptional regulator [Oscillospiraceae bacterium]|nr:helix-turn-helix transcriptional regulator [Oscillospiraceae bacterium]
MTGFRRERLKARKTIKEVMQCLGVSDAAVYQWETNIYKPSAENLLKLANFYGCTMEALMTDTEDPDSIDGDTSGMEEADHAS